MKIIYYALILLSLNSFSQDKYLTKAGLITFEASVPAFEEVAAKNNSVTAIIDTENGHIAVLAFIKGFRFKNALMEEHFNENYAESDTYPKATFKGSIKNLKIDSKPNIFELDGVLTFHGVKNELEDLQMSIVMKENILMLEGSFEVKASDFNIEIPKIVSNKIAEQVRIAFKFKLEKK